MRGDDDERRSVLLCWLPFPRLVGPVAVDRRVRGLTAAEAGRRWNMDTEQAREWLRAFERRGYACREGRRWYPTRKAFRIQGFGPEGE